MKGRIDIRSVQVDDLRDIYLLGCELFGNPGAPFQPAWNETNIADVLTSDRGLSRAAISKNKIAGFIIASLDETDGGKTALIHWLGIQEFRPAVLLTDMLNSLASEAAERNIEKIVIALPVLNSELIEYYRNFGFTESNRFIIMENFLPKNS